jgi:cytoplasmic iron level regulating protein YaaA (DUF328/UPF0246 family)
MFMLVVVSPAKKLDMQPKDGLIATEPTFSGDAKELAAVAKELSIHDLQELMGISEKLAQLNSRRFSSFGKQDKKSAAFAFAGDTYKGLEAETLTSDDVAWAQNHLRILSGLYGILRPLDEIEPYRLEMGSQLITQKGKSLYTYWGNQISQALNIQAAKNRTKTLINCASQEYFGAIDIPTLTMKVITPVFMETKSGKSKIISFYAKKARGMMARFIIQNRLKKIHDLFEFNSEGYVYNPEQSSPEKLIFLRNDTK